MRDGGDLGCVNYPHHEMEKTKSSILSHRVLPVANDRFEDNLTDRNICDRAHQQCVCVCV